MSILGWIVAAALILTGVLVLRSGRKNQVRASKIQGPVTVGDNYGAIRQTSVVSQQDAAASTASRDWVGWTLAGLGLLLAAVQLYLDHLAE